MGKRGLVVEFDNSSRVDFITGFRKRKQARRVEALERKVEQERVALKDARREVRSPPKARYSPGPRQCAGLILPVPCPSPRSAAVS
jgi:hypothetical protein